MYNYTNVYIQFIGFIFSALSNKLVLKNPFYQSRNINIIYKLKFHITFLCYIRQFYLHLQTVIIQKRISQIIMLMKQVKDKLDITTKNLCIIFIKYLRKHQNI